MEENLEKKEELEGFSKFLLPTLATLLLIPMLSSRLFKTSPEAEKSEEKPWTPYRDMVEYADRYEILIELPGVEKEDIRISVKNNILTISGEKKKYYEKKEDVNLQYQSISYGKFQTEFSIPSDVITEKISASYKNGVLKLTLPKSVKEEEKEINVEFE